MDPLEHIIEFLKAKDKLTLASDLLDEFKSSSSSLQQFDILGRLYHDVKSYQKALECVEECKKLAQPENRYSINCNLIKILNEINEPKQALEIINENLSLNPNDTSMLMEKNFSHFLLNEKSESEKILRDLLEKTDDEKIKAKIKFNLGTYDLEHGKFQQGLRGFILGGKDIGIWPQDGIPEYLRVSDSNPLKAGDKLLIKADGGIGDEVINIRFMKILKDRDIDATWLTTREDLKNLFNYNGYKTITYKDFTNYYDYDKVATSMALPIWLNLSEEEIWFGNYLKPTEESRAKFAYMKEEKAPKIGLRWGGSVYYEQNLHRTLNFESLYKVVKEKYPRAKLYSLQFPKDDIIDKYYDIIDMSTKITTFDDTLAIIENLDFIITSCTSIAHACGALNKETFVLVPISAYYTWDSPHHSRESNESIWYSKNLKIIKQTIYNSKEKEYEQLRELI